MNKKDKELIEKIKDNYSSRKSQKFSMEENKMIDRFVVNGILNKEAFIDITGNLDSHKVFLQGTAYPITALGEKEFTKHWYLDFRNSMVVVVIRDFLTVVAFIFSLYLTYLKVFQSSP